MTAASIVTYNVSDEELGQAVATLLQCDEIVRIDIVDNSRNTSTRNLVLSFNNPRLNYIPSENIGYGAANNISIRKSLADPAIDCHLVLNSDIEFSPAVIDELKALMDSDRSIALTIPKVLDQRGKEQSSYHPLPSPWDLIVHRFMPRRLFAKRLERYEIKVDGLSEPVNVPYVHGCFMMMRCEALRKVGVFDERFFMYPEDIDLTRRLNEHYQTLVVPSLSIVHHHRGQSRKSIRLLLVHIMNMIKYFNKWGWFGTGQNRHSLRQSNQQFREN